VSDQLHISVDELRRATAVLLDHLQTVEGDVVAIPDRMFWTVPADARYEVYEQPTDLTIGQVSESLEHLSSVTKIEEDALSYGLVWLADVLRAIGERTVR
jgi:hypothetical protein